MSSSTSSVSILTTVPVTMSPSSNSTIVASIASASDMPPRSSRTTSSFWPCSSSSSCPTRRARRRSAVSAVVARRLLDDGGVDGFRVGLVGRAALLGDGGAGRLRHVLIRQLLTPRRCEPLASLADRRARVAGPRFEAERQAQSLIQSRLRIGGRNSSATPVRASRRASRRSSGWSSVGACRRTRPASPRAPRPRRVRHRGPGARARAR